MKFMKKIGLLCLLSALATSLHAQVPLADWHYFFDAYSDCDLADLEMDADGYTYAAFNYQGSLSLKGIANKMPHGLHMHACVVRIDPKGKPVWATPIRSGNDNRIRDIALCPNGDLVITGFADGRAAFPAGKDTLRIGRVKTRDDYHHPQNFYAARLNKDGAFEWVHGLRVKGWGDGLAIATNSKNEVFWQSYYYGAITPEDKSAGVYDTFPYPGKGWLFEVLDAKNGKVIPNRRVIENNDKGQIRDVAGLYVDIHQNLYRYGGFKKAISTSNGDSLRNDGYWDGNDAYLMKFDSNGVFQWARQVGGHNGQYINGLVVDSSGYVYFTGSYDYECYVSDGIRPVQKSKYEYRSGSSFFYACLNASGDLEFLRYAKGRGYGRSLMGSDLQVLDDGRVLLCGIAEDTVSIDGITRIFGSQMEPFLSVWNGEKMEQMEFLTNHNKGWMANLRLRRSKTNWVMASMYYGDGLKLTSTKGNVALTMEEHGRSSVAFGGKLPETDKPIPALAQRQNRRALRLAALKPLMACLKPNEEAPPAVWFVSEDSLQDSGREAWLNAQPCGLEVQGIEARVFPNPSRGPLTLSLKGLKGQVLVTLYSESGAMVIRQLVEVPENTFELGFDLSGHASGVYVISLRYQSFEKALRWVKL
jgi:hypothetical protein